jgi:1,4-alpha-glucan branching enzyme
MRYDVTLLGEGDLHLFNEGTHYLLYQKLGSHVLTAEGVEGTYFAVWAPNAKSVSVIGDFNFWNRESHPLRERGGSGIWEGFIPGIGRGTVYKYFIVSHARGYSVEKADPLAIYDEIPPKTASIVHDLRYEWGDRDWIRESPHNNSFKSPISIYEVHLGSWKRVPEDNYRSLSYREMAPQLVDYVKRTGFTHVEFLPVMEHPFFGSWGYQITGFFAPTSRYGSPQDFMFLIDHLHQNGIGVYLDWVPSHFPTDEHGLAYFDGTHLYEHADPRQGFHPQWNSYIFNYGRNEVRSFLMSSALYWLDIYHADGLRVDGVASMLYLDYARNEGEWIPNPFGGKENLEAVSFLRRFNEDVYRNHPNVQTVAEESTSWPMVSRPTYLGGLGFSMKWDMGWMHDTLQYFSKDPIHRHYHHNQLTFRQIYAHTENFVLPLSHDEVVYGKGALLRKMAGDDWQKFANLRLLFGYMFAQTGKKLLFMGGEFGQWDEWNHDGSLQWNLLEYPPHVGLQTWVRDLNYAYRRHPALHQGDFDSKGFEWIDCTDAATSVLILLRKAQSTGQQVVVVLNFTPVVRENYRIGVPYGGYWNEILNSDAPLYGGSGQGNAGGLNADSIPHHGRPCSLNLKLPPLGVLFFRSPGED